MLSNVHTNIFVLCMQVPLHWLSQGSVGLHVSMAVVACSTPETWSGGCSRAPGVQPWQGKLHRGGSLFSPPFDHTTSVFYDSFWLCGLGRILMDSLICSLFWGARISGIIAFAVQFAIVNAVRTVMHNCCRSQLASSVRIFPSDCLN